MHALTKVRAVQWLVRSLTQQTILARLFTADWLRPDESLDQIPLIWGAPAAQIGLKRIDRFSSFRVMRLFRLLFVLEELPWSWGLVREHKSTLVIINDERN